MKRSICRCLFFCLAMPMLAQSAANEVTPAVQKLYSEAKAAQQQGDDTTAIEKYGEMIRLAPRLGAAYNNLGMLYFNRRLYAEAAPVLERGLSVDAGMQTATALLGLSYFELGEDQ